MSPMGLTTTEFFFMPFHVAWSSDSMENSGDHFLNNDSMLQREFPSRNDRDTIASLPLVLKDKVVTNPTRFKERGIVSTFNRKGIKLLCFF